MNRGSRVKQPTNEPYFSFENFMFSNLTRVTTEEKECQICRRINTVAYLYKDITYYSHYECLSLYFLYRFFGITKSTHYSLKEANNASSDNANLTKEGDSLDTTNPLNKEDESATGRDDSKAIAMEVDGVDSVSVDNAADESANTSADVASKGKNEATASTAVSNTQFITLYDIYKGNIQEPLDYDFYGTHNVEAKPTGNKNRRCYSCGINDPHFKCFVQECNNYMHVNCSGNGHMVVYTNPLVNLNVYTSLRNKPMNVIAPIIINSSVNQAGETGPSEQELVIDNYLKCNIIHVKDRFISYRFMLCYKHINDAIISNIKLLFLYRFMVIKEYQYVHTIINVIAEYNASIAKTKEDKKNRTLYKPLQVSGLTPTLSVSTPTSSIELLGEKKLQPETIGLNREVRKPQKMLPKREVGMKNEFRRDMMMLRNRSELGRTEYDHADEKEDRRNALMINNLMCEYNLYKKSNVQKNNKPFNPSNFNILFQPTTLSININSSSNLNGLVDVNLVNIRDDEVLENDIRLLLNLSGQISNIHELKKLTIQNEFNIQNVVQVIKQLLYSPKHTDSSELTHLKNINSMNKVNREGSEEYEQQETNTEALTEKDIYRSVMKKPKFALLKLYNKYVWMCMTKMESGFKGEEETVDSRMVMLEYVVLSSMEYIYIKNIVNSIYYHNNTLMLLIHAGSKNNKLKSAEEEGENSPGVSSGEGVSEGTSTPPGEVGRGDVINLCGYSWDMNPPLYKFYKVHHSNTQSPTDGSSIINNTGSENLVITSNTNTMSNTSNTSNTKSTGSANAVKSSDEEDTDQYQNCFVYKQSIAILSALKSINNNIETYKKNIEKNIAKDSVKYNNLCFDTGYVDFFSNVSTALHRYNHFKQSIRRSILHYNPVDASNNLDYMKHSDANDATSNADKGYSVNTSGDGKYIAGKTTDGNYTQNNKGAERSYNNNGGDEDTNNNEGEGNESDNNGMDEDEPGYSLSRRSSIGSGSLTSISSSGIKGGDSSKHFVKKASGTSRVKSEEGGYTRNSSSSSTKKEEDEEYHVAIDTSTGTGGNTTNNKAADEKKGTSLASGRTRRSTTLSSGLRSRRHTPSSKYLEKDYETDTNVGGSGGNRGVVGKARSATSGSIGNAGSSNIDNHNAINRTGIVSSGMGKRYSVIRSVDSNHGAFNSGSNNRNTGNSGVNNLSNSKGDDDVSNNEDEDNDGVEISGVGKQSSVGGYGSYKSSIGTGGAVGGVGDDKERGGKVKITKEYCSVCLLSELSHKHILIQCQKCYLRIHYKCYYNYRLSNLLNNPTASPAPKDKETKTGFYCDPCSKEYNQRYETNYNSAICISCLSSGGAMKAIYAPSSSMSHSINYQMYRGYGVDKMAQGLGSNYQSGNYQYDPKMNEMNRQGYRGMGYGAGVMNGFGGYPGGPYANMNMRAKNTKGDKRSGEDEKWIHLICLVFLMPKVVCYDFVNLNQWYLPNRMETMSTCSICGVVGGIQVKCTYSSQGEKEEEYYEQYNVGVNNHRNEMKNGINGMVNGTSGSGMNVDNMVNGTSNNMEVDGMPNGTSSNMNGDNMVNGTSNMNHTFKGTQNNHNHVNSNHNVSNDKGYGDTKINGRCDCELTFHPMCCLLSGCYIRYSNKNNINLKQYQLHTFMSNFFNEAMQNEGQDEHGTYNTTNHTKNMNTRRDLDSVLNNLFQSIVLEPLCLKHTIELHTEKFVREQTASRCYAYTHYLYHPDGFKNKKKYNSLPLEPIYSPVTITKNGPVKSQPRILPQHYDSNFPVDVVTKRAKYNEPYLISVVYGLPKAMYGDVPKYGITAITNYLSNSQQCNNQHNNSQSGTSQNNSQKGKGSEIKNMCDDKMWIPKLQQQYMINK